MIDSETNSVILLQLYVSVGAGGRGQSEQFAISGMTDQESIEGIAMLFHGCMPPRNGLKMVLHNAQRLHTCPRKGRQKLQSQFVSKAGNVVQFAKWEDDGLLKARSFRAESEEPNIPFAVSASCFW